MDYQLEDAYPIHPFVNPADLAWPSLDSAVDSTASSNERVFFDHETEPPLQNFNDNTESGLESSSPSSLFGLDRAEHPTSNDSSLLLLPFTAATSTEHQLHTGNTSTHNEQLYDCQFQSMSFGLIPDARDVAVHSRASTRFRVDSENESINGFGSIHLASGPNYSPQMNSTTLGRYTGNNQVLEIWFETHRDNPYPSREEKAQLANASGKTVKQVENWFSNGRSRGRGTHRHSLNGTPGQHYSSSLTSPIESPFNTGVHDSVLMSEHTSTSGPSDGVGNHVMTKNEYTGPNSPRPGRRGKRRAVIPSSSNGSPLSLASPHAPGPSAWPCTFCEYASKDMYEWKRHEATHVPGIWICMPDKVAFIGNCCALCGAQDPKLSHFETHANIDTCKAAPLSNRSFARKDKLQDHIRRVHHQRPDVLQGDVSSLTNRMNPKLLNAWKREPDFSVTMPQALWCGFCRVYCSTWSERQSHVANHLRNGCTLPTWQVSI